MAFSLHHPRGSQPETDFLRAAKVLASIPGVQRFEQLAQVSPKCEYAFSFSMEFDGAAAYSAYNAHPDHVAFVEERWVKEVIAFQELDFEPLPTGAPEQEER